MTGIEKKELEIGRVSTSESSPVQWKELSLPLTEEDVEGLRAGDAVSLSGPLYLVSDLAAKWLEGLFSSGEESLEELGIQFENATFYFASTGNIPVGKVIGSLAPAYTENYQNLLSNLIERKVRCLIGRGPLSDEVHNQLKKFHSVYAITIGGAGALLARSVYSAQVLSHPENEALGKDALKLIKVKKFPAIIGMDSFGRNCLKVDQIDYSSALDKEEEKL